MRNPFKTKQLEDFTIEDCEIYLENYPYGEHYAAVKNRQKSLKSGKIKSPEEKKDRPKCQSPESKSSASTSSFSTNKMTSPPTTNSSSNQQQVKSEIKSDSNSNDIVDTILSWIGLIVVVLIVGTIIIFVLDAILPEGTAKFINKYRYLIYPAGLALARWLDDKN